MPWKVTDVMQERIRFVSEVLRGQENISALGPSAAPYERNTVRSDGFAAAVENS